jgi:hypothetical protein
MAFYQASAGQVNIGDCVYYNTSLQQGGLNTATAANQLAWPSAIATPSAPTLTNTTTTLATGLTANATGVKVSYVFPWGEGTLSAAGTVTPTANAAILLSGIALPSPAIGLNVYVESSAGSGIYKLYGQYDTVTLQQGQGSVLITGYGQGSSPPTAVAQDAQAIAQYNFAQLFLGVSAQRFDGSNVNAYGIKDGRIRIDTAGVFDFACASATFNVGDWVGLAKGTGNFLDPQTVIAVANRTQAIGRVVQQGTSVTTVRVEIMPFKITNA